MFRCLMLLVVAMVSMVSIANAAVVNTPFRLVGAILIVDQRNSQVEAISINAPAETAAVCELMKSAITANGFTGGNYDYKSSVQRTYSLTCVNTNAVIAP